MKKKLLIIMFLFLMPLNVFAKTIGTHVETVTLSKCVDGDTARFMLNKEEIKVRFLAIDTPESVHPTKAVEAYGKDASEYTCKMLTNAEKIELEYDPKSDEKDKYGRVLAWIYVDDELLQNNLIKVGYAKVAYLYGDYLYTTMLKTSEKEAKDSKLGIWSDEEVTEVVDVKDATKEEEKEKSSSLFDLILDFLNEILEKILEFIENLIEDVL